ncbi:MAG: MFS transporter [Mycobacteriales bacterium]
MTYRSVLADREFAAVFVSQGLSTLGDQLARIAIAVVVFQRTGSALAASATYAASYLTYLLGGPPLSALADRHPRVAMMVLCDLLRAPVVLLLCVTGLPLWAYFAVVVAVGALGPPFDSARSAMLPDILDGDRYTKGVALLNLTVHTANVLGFVLGGALVSLVSARGALSLDAATFLLSAGAVLGCVRHRPLDRERTSDSLFQDTRLGFQLVSRTPELRSLLGWALLGSAAIIAPEGLAVPVAAGLGGGALAAGVLTAAVPAGFLVASVLVLRVDPSARVRLLPRLAVLACVPLLLTPLGSEVWHVALLWSLAGAGGTVNLVASTAYVQACPREYRGRAFGVAITALNVVQGSVLLLAGLLAVPFTSPESVALVALATLGLVGATARAATAVQGSGHLVRYGER